MALYFSIFKNPNHVDFYDAKVELFNKFSDLDHQLARNFYEAVSINEINVKKFCGNSTQVNSRPIRQGFNNFFLTNIFILVIDR